VTESVEELDRGACAFRVDPGQVIQEHIDGAVFRDEMVRLLSVAIQYRVTPFNITGTGVMPCNAQGLVRELVRHALSIVRCGRRREHLSASTCASKAASSASSSVRRAAVRCCAAACAASIALLRVCGDSANSL
jgi:hypothetical protein